VTSTADKWNQRYVKQLAAAVVPQPAAVLTANAALLPPPPGPVLDLACGLGANAKWLAARGFAVTAWDISPVAINDLRRSSAGTGWMIDAAVRDVLQAPPASGAYQAIIVANFLERSLFPHLVNALAPGGVLFYQTFTLERAPDGPGPANPEYLLAVNELLLLCDSLHLRYYHEPGRADADAQGLAQLVAQKQAG